MKRPLYHFTQNRRAITACLICGGILTGYPLTSFAVQNQKVEHMQQQQKRAITGVVKDAAGQPVIGASVVEKGNTSNGSITDLDGKFSLKVAPNATLQVSYIGYTTQEVAVGDKTTVDVILAENNEMLDEVVVVGFGTQKKVNLTGSVAVADAKLIEQRPVNNAVTALQGVVPGLNITTSGLGGTLDAEKSVNVRGTGTIGNSSGSPLVLIDGMEGDLNAINPQDIESISVLKDAAAASIYGSRAPFGVILVTTKSGKEGRVNVTYNNSFRYKTPLYLPNMMNSVEFINYNNDAFGNAGMQLVDGKYVPGNGRWGKDLLEKAQQYMDGTLIDPRTGAFNPYYTQPTDASGKWDGNNAWANVDWMKEMYRNWTPAQEHNLSISGGTEKINYYFSANYLDEDGTLRHGTENMKRYTMTGKFSAKLNDYVKMDFSSRFTRSDYDKPSSLTGGMYDNLLRRAYPTRPLYDGNGLKQYDSNYAWLLEDGGHTTLTQDALSNQLKATFTPIKNWNIIGEFNFRIENNWTHTESFYLESTLADGVTKTKGGLSPNYSTVREEAFNGLYLNPNIYTNYNFTLNEKHNFAATVGFQAESYDKKNVYGQRGPLVTNDKPVLDLAFTNDINQLALGGELQKWRTAGFFGRVNYDFDGKYLFEANLRYDGSSRFRSDSRWVWTPSFSLGWNMARESFFEDLSRTINLLKVRASWGTLANQNTNTWYPTYATYGFSTSSWLLGGVKPNTASVPSLISPTLTWEKIYTTNLGLDWGAFNNRLTGSFDYFIRKTKDMVKAGVELPAILGTSVPDTNNTDLKTYGWELTLGWRDNLGDFSYGVSLNLSDSQTKILKYANPTGKLSDYREGAVTGQIWGYVSKGIAKTQEEMDQHIASLPNGGQTALGTGAWYAGDMMYEDLNGDGKIDAGSSTLADHGDLKVIGNTTPRYRMGINLDASWKGLDLQMFWQGVLKRDWYPLVDGGREDLSFFGWSQRGEWWSAYFKEHLDYWRDENSALGANPNAYYTRVYRDGTHMAKNHTTQTHFLQDASYMRLKNLTIGYTLPQVWTKKVGINKLRLFVSGENLLTISHIHGDVLDPESAGIGQGASGTSYPLSQTYSFGLSVNF